MRPSDVARTALRWKAARKVGASESQAAGQSVDRATGDRVLVAGWFSWPHCGATAGDLLARDVACEWLRRAGRTFDVANHPAFGEGVDWRRVNPADYRDLVFVCGPLEPSSPWEELSKRFAHARKVGLDLTMLRSLAEWNPFDVLLERDSDRAARPDLSFAAPLDRVPVVGLVLVPQYTPEYPDRDRQQDAKRAAVALAERHGAVTIPIDTALLRNGAGLRTAREVESLIGRMDLVITTRLHGLVLALKQGVPAIAIDPVAGGSKIVRQAETIGWPAARAADSLDDRDLDRLFDFCQTEEARRQAEACATTALAQLETVEVDFRGALRAGSAEGLPTL